MADPEYRPVLTVDIEDSAGRGNVALVSIREVLFDALEHALRRSGIEWDACVRVDTGDGIHVVAPPGTGKIRLIHPLIPELVECLRAHNRVAGPALQVRVRVAIHAGELRLEPNGTPVGLPLEIVARLVDSAPLRDALRAAPPTTPLALLVSRHVFEDTVSHGYPGVIPEDYTKVAVTVKKYADDAWLYVPGIPVSAPARVPVPVPVSVPGTAAAATIATPRVFISHAIQDLRDVGLARRIHGRLEAAGAEPSTSDELRNQDLAADPADLIERSTHFLVIVSEAAAHSDQVRREVELAVARHQAGAGLRILPLFVGSPDDDGPPWLKLLQPFQNVPHHPDVERQLLEVVRAVGAELSPWVPQLSYVRHKTAGFVGRRFAFDQFEAFFYRHPCGHILVEGMPGVGKTSLLAEAARRRNWPAHFNIHAQGIGSPAAFLESLHTQLSMRYDLSLPPPRTDDDRDGRYLDRLLAAAADRLRPAERLVIVVDALDEVSMGRPGLNPLFLPTVLPAGLYLLLSRRNNTAPLQIEGDSHRVDLMAHHAESRSDAEAYIRASLAEPGMEARLDGVADLDSVVAGLLEHSELNFMYLMYILRDIDQGRMHPEDLSQLPYGLRKYYERHWQRMQSGGARAALGLRTIYTLAKLRTPVPASLLAQIIGVEELEVLHLLEDWAQFLGVAVSGGTRTYSFYHQDFCDFLMDQDTVRAARIDLTEISSMIGLGLSGSGRLGIELDP